MINTYVENQKDIIHHTLVDFSLRPVPNEINIVQYDKSLPIVKVDLYQNGKRYQLEENDTIFVRFGKNDHTFVYDAILGASEDRKSVYFEISEQMATVAGKVSPVLELTRSEKIAQSSPIPITINKNPIQDGDIESESDANVIRELVDEAVDAANDAGQYARDAAASEANVQQMMTDFQQNAMTEAEALEILMINDTEGGNE